MDVLDGIGPGEVGIFGVGIIFKVLFILIFTGYLGYAFMLTLRIRILNDTVKTDTNGFVRLLTYIHLLVALIGSLFGVILVLLG